MLIALLIRVYLISSNLREEAVRGKKIKADIYLLQPYLAPDIYLRFNFADERIPFRRRL
jgi:hypothetical protein